MRTSQSRRVAVVAFPDVLSLDVTGPLEVFAAAGRLAAERDPSRPTTYAVEILGPNAGPIRTQSGFRIVADRAWGSVTHGIDTLLVAGGEGTIGALRDRQLLAWLRRIAPRVRRLGSVCSGTFILAEAGLLDGRRATTHWSVCGLLAERYPKIRVESDPIFVRDGTVYSSAGVTAGIDLALALVEEDLGREMALQTARRLVVFLKRPGGQSQFSAQLAAQAAEREPIRELQAWIADHPGADCGVAKLARRVAMSPRNFARVFAREVGVTPGHYVETARVEAARRRLDESADPVETIAARTGFGTAETMRRAFLRTLGVPPSAYRGRFRTALAS